MPWPNRFAKGPLAFAVEIYLEDPSNAHTLLEELSEFLKKPDFYDVPKWDFFQRLGGFPVDAPEPEGSTNVLRHTFEYFGLEEYLEPHAHDAARSESRSEYGNDAGTAGYGYGEDHALAAFKALKRALEVSLGLPGSPRKPLGVAQPSHLDKPAPWPIEIFWSCGQPETRSWVTWRENPIDARFGQVTLVFSAAHPAVGGELIKRNKADKIRAGYRGHDLVGAAPGAQRGMEAFRVDSAVPGVHEYELRGNSGIPNESLQDEIRRWLARGSVAATA